MNLDDTRAFAGLDTQNYLADIDGLPGQVEQAWALGQAQRLPAGYAEAGQVLIAGMGGSAIGGTLAQALVAPECRLPIQVLRDYSLPAYVGPGTLVIASSHSGNTEETLAAAQAALERGARVVALTRGGKLGALAEAAGRPVWRFEHAGQPRAAVGFSLMLTLAVLHQAGAIGDPSPAVAQAVAAMRAQQPSLAADSPAVRNPAKRMAGQLMGRLAVIFASGTLAPVARRWKGQINELAKASAAFDELPELDHNTVVGTLFPEPLVSKYMVLFLSSAHDHARNRLRAEVTREIFMTSGFNTDAIAASGPGPLADMLTLLHYGDYVAYYLAMAYGIDPSPIPQIDYLKEQLATRAGG
jgi:glucose/mannose-6-phosphate isomerase